MLVTFILGISFHLLLCDHHMIIVKIGGSSPERLIAPEIKMIGTANCNCQSLLHTSSRRTWTKIL